MALRPHSVSELVEKGGEKTCKDQADKFVSTY